MTAGSDQRRDDRQLMAEVRARLWQWDPIGLAELGAPNDEYDCLVGPISSALRRGVSTAELASTLSAEVSDHFGVEAAGTRVFTEDLVKWHTTRSAVESQRASLTDDRE